MEVVLGMAHRGRLNVLANIMGKPYVAIFSEFQGHAAHPDEVQGSGDVKYHLGTSADRSFDGDEIHLSLTANPSHLEAVDPVVLGKVRAKQTQRGDAQRNQVMGILIHGDAAIAGQGLAAECFELSELKGYRVGGTIHFIINNQIGFTTSPSYSRSSPYSSDVAKMVQAPIFHVNGDDPEAVVHVARIATEFRQEFKRDVVIDMFCYRRFGHNEADEPSFTQPIMYRTIARQPTTRQVYADKLIGERMLTADEVDRMAAEVREKLQQAFEAAAQYKPNKADWLQGRWAGLKTLIGEEELRDDETWVSNELLHDIGRALHTYPSGFHIHRKLTRLLDARREMIETGEGLDWATGEALALGSLLAEGVAVRLSGQDSGRGTFSHRHAVLVDQEDESRYIPLNHISDGQANFEVIDSPLSEASVLGFEYGYSLVEPDALVIWEAQFGDFANGAQVIIDQFIAPGESKWLRLSGLAMLLPHGYEGQGPEHSSARIERYLQLCAEDNLQVVNCTTPANYFHALRRQVRRNFRKPLIVFSPKSLLRHKLAVSRLDEFGPGTRFQRLLPEVDPLVADDKVRRIVFCSGKVYYDLLQERRKRGIDDVVIARVRATLPVAPAARCRAVQALWQRRGNLVSGRAGEHGRLAVRAAALAQHPGRAEARSRSADLRRAQGGGLTGDGAAQGARRGTAAARRASAHARPRLSPATIPPRRALTSGEGKQAIGPDDDDGNQSAGARRVGDRGDGREVDEGGGRRGRRRRTSGRAGNRQGDRRGAGAGRRHARRDRGRGR